MPNGLAHPYTSGMNQEPFSWASPTLRSQLLADPSGYLRQRGINLPADFSANLVEEFVRIASLLWVEGSIVSLEDFRIDPADEGLLFGRGVWESTKTVAGIPWLWSMHVERLVKSAEILGIDLKPERVPTEQQVTDYVRGLTGQDVVIRLNVTAGRPGASGLLWMSAAIQPLIPPSIRLLIYQNPIEKGQAYLTLKTFQYATRLRLGKAAAAQGFDTALLVDATGNFQEATHANLFIRLPEGWLTPSADGGLLPGTVRRHLLQSAPVTIREQVVHQSRLGEIQEAFVTNSNLGIVPVAQIDGKVLPVGQETLQLIQWLTPPTPSTTQYRFITRS